jgi:hypothetical protein
MLSGQKRLKFVICQLKGAKKCTPFAHLIWAASNTRWKSAFILRIINVLMNLFENTANAKQSNRQKKKDAWTIE